MNRTTRYLAILIAAGVAVLAAVTVLIPVNLPVTGWIFGSKLEAEDAEDFATRVSVPPGYAITVYATDVGNARAMQITAIGDILVTTKSEGNVLLIKRDGDGDGLSDGVETLISGLESPHGIWIEGNNLYIGEEHQVVRYRYDAQARTAASPTVVLPDLPDGGGHSTRTVARGPDGLFYVTIGSSCNVCIEDHPWRAAIVRFKRDGSDPELFATGLRNTVGFDWRPETGELYGVDNARDWLGDDFPPDELNLIVEGGFYGWPYFNGDNVPDPDHGKDEKAKSLDPIPPAHAFQAHVAPLSITFLKHQAGTPLEGAALVGQHGSWNRSVKIGYSVVSLHWDENGNITRKVFADGFEKDGDVIGRPVDVAEAPDGTLYISDDYADAIYKVVRSGG